MNARPLDRIGNWNPQLYREIRGKLRPRNLIVVVLMSLLFQGILILINSSYNPERIPQWDFQWLATFTIINWLLPIASILIGVYFISSDISRELQRGTLNFVRLSPQASEKILAGKLLGVPILLYLGIALTLPLHLYSGLVIGSSLFSLLGNYILWGALCGVFYNAASLAVLSFDGKGEHQKPIAGICSLLSLMFAPTGVWIVYNANHLFSLKIDKIDYTWFFLPNSFTYVWILGTLLTLNFWLWQAANRCFRHPNHTVINKAQSYWIVGISQLWLLGFAFPELLVDRETDGGGVGAFCLFLLAPPLILLMAALLSPSRQTLLDWARYRHWQKAEKRGLLPDLLLGEKSPSLGAIAFHYVLIGMLWLPWLVLYINSPSFWNSSENFGEIFNVWRFAIALAITAMVFAIYATVYQSIRFHAKNFNRAIARSIPWGIAFLTPTLLLVIFQLNPGQAPLLWAFTPLAFIGVFYTSTAKLLFAFASQFVLLAFLTRRLQQHLQRAGASEFKRQVEEKDLSSTERAIG